MDPFTHQIEGGKLLALWCPTWSEVVLYQSRRGRGTLALYVFVGGILGVVLDVIAAPQKDGLLFTLGGATAAMVLFFIRRKYKGKDG